MNAPCRRLRGWIGWLVAGLIAGCGRPPAVIESAASGPAPAAGAVKQAAGAVKPVVGAVKDDDVEVPNLADVPFTLRDQTGAEVSTDALRGRVVLGAIFFANCPGPCFRENQAIADLLRAIRDPDLIVVSLTCDPANDTPEVLAKYAARFDADPDRWKFLTGDLSVIEQVGQKVFRLPVELGVHSERGVIFDRQGRLRGGYHLLDSDKLKQLEALAREVLAEAPPAPETGIVP